MTQSPAIRLVTELALANQGFVALPPGGVDGNALVKSGTGVVWGSGAGGTAVNSVNGRTGTVTLSKTDVGLANTDNTSDLLKPISTATQAALNAKTDYPAGGLDGQVLTKSGATTAWATSTSGSGVTLITTADSFATITSKLLTPGVVRFAPGTYNVGANTLYVYGTTRTIVQGYGAIINSTMNDAIMRVNNADHVIEGLTFVGQGLATTGQGGLIAYGAGSIVRNCTFKNLSRFGILMSGAHGSSVIGNVLDNCSLGPDHGAASIASIFTDANYVSTLNNHITNCFWGISYRGADATTGAIIGGLIQGNWLQCRPSAASDAQGISSANARNQRTINNYIDSFPNNSIDNWGCFYNTIEGNSCSNGGGDGIFVGHAGTHSVTVTGNSIQNCGTGVRVWDTANYVTVAANVIDGCTYAGIQARGSINSGESPISNVTITGNQINGENGTTAQAGIWVSNCTIAIITSNQVTRPTKQGIYLQSVDLAKVQNNTLQDPSYNAPGQTYNGIDLDSGCNRAMIDDNLVYGVAKACVAVAAGVGHRLRGNRFRGGYQSTISDSGTATVASDNVAI